MLALGSAFIKSIIERAVNNQFDKDLESYKLDLNRSLESYKSDLNRSFEFYKSDLSRNLESYKSDLTAWNNLRKDILAEMWNAHLDIFKKMTLVILKVQELETQKKPPSELKLAIDEYRQGIHNNMFFLSPDAMSICQLFLNAAYEICQGQQDFNDAINLKNIRNNFTGYIVRTYQLDDRIMPWAAIKSPGEKAPGEKAPGEKAPGEKE